VDADHARQVQQVAERLHSLDQGAICTSLVLEHMASQTKCDVGTLSIVDSQLVDFCYSRIKMNHLQGFICCRDNKYEKKASFPKKGKFEDVEAGTDCLLKLAFDLRAHPIILQHESVPLERAPEVPANKASTTVVAEEVDVKPRQLLAQTFAPTDLWLSAA